MLRAERVRSKYASYIAQSDEFKTDCYCSECGNYLGSKDFTHPAAIGRVFTDDINFCQYCGAALYEQD